MLPMLWSQLHQYQSTVAILVSGTESDIYVVWLHLAHDVCVYKSSTHTCGVTTGTQWNRRYVAPLGKETIAWKIQQVWLDLDITQAFQA